MGKVSPLRIGSFCSRRSLLCKCDLHELHLEEGKLEVYHIHDNPVWIILLGLLPNNRHPIIFIFRLQHRGSLQELVLDKSYFSCSLYSVLHY
jgi:hypothetical protein